MYSGYYAVLALLISAGLMNFSRVITVPLRLLTTLLMLYVIIKTSRKNKINFFTLKTNLILIVFWSVFFIKVLYDYYIGTNLFRSWYEYVFYCVNFCILPYFMYSKIDYNTYKETIINAIVLSGFTMGVICLFLYKDLLVMGLGRISEASYLDSKQETLNPLALSYCSVLTIGFCIYKILFTKVKNLRFILYIYTTIILSFIMFFLGASRGSVVALFFTLVCFYFYSNLKIRKKIIKLLLLTTPLVILGVIKSKTAVFDRIFNSSSKVNIDTFGRGDLWRLAWSDFINNPFFGGHIELIDVPYYRDGMAGNIYPHNIILEVFMSSGIFVGLLFVYVLFNSSKLLLKTVKKNSKSIWILIIFIQGISQYMFTGAVYTAILIFFPLGLISSVSSVLKLDVNNDLN
jgi:hypothetical protein